MWLSFNSLSMYSMQYWLWHELDAHRLFLRFRLKCAIRWTKGKREQEWNRAKGTSSEIQHWFWSVSIFVLKWHLHSISICRFVTWKWRCWLHSLYFVEANILNCFLSLRQLFTLFLLHPFFLHTFPSECLLLAQQITYSSLIFNVRSFNVVSLSNNNVKRGKFRIKINRTHIQYQ